MSNFSVVSVDNYKQMLSKLALYNGIFTFICLIILSTYAAPIKDPLEGLNRWLADQSLNTLVGVPAKLGAALLISVLVAVCSHAFKLHDLLSKLFKIREEFDVRFVVYPLAIGSGVSLSATKLTTLKEERSQLLAKTFYKYVSSTNPVIDSHTISQALTNWSWFWICLEASLLLSITACILVANEAFEPACWVLIVCVLLLLFMRFFRFQSAYYAESQVTQVLQDDIRRTEVAKVFNAL
jgi:hypothetical protein